MRLQTCGQCWVDVKNQRPGCGSCRISEMWKCDGDGVGEVAPGPVSRGPLSQRAGRSFLWGT